MCMCNNIQIIDPGHMNTKTPMADLHTPHPANNKTLSKNFVSGSCQSKHNERSSENKMLPAAQLATGQLLF